MKSRFSRYAKAEQRLCSFYNSANEGVVGLINRHILFFQFAHTGHKPYALTLYGSKHEDALL